MSFGLPVVSTDEGAISEIVIEGKTGYRVPKNDPEALADALHKLIANTSGLREMMGSQAIKEFKEKYTLEVFERNLAGALNEIIAGFRRPQ